MLVLVVGSNTVKILTGVAKGTHTLGPHKKVGFEGQVLFGPNPASLYMMYFCLYFFFEWTVLASKHVQVIYRFFSIRKIFFFTVNNLQFP